METDDSKPKRKALERRNEEASIIIKALLERGATMESIARTTKVSERTVYRWFREGRAPHPILLESLRRMGNRHAVHQESQE